MAAAKPETNGADLRILSVSDILDAPDIIEEVVPVPEWHGAVRIRALSIDEVFDIRKESMREGGADEEEAAMLMIVHGVVAPQFTPAHVTLLRKKNAGAINRILNRINAISGITREAVNTAKATFPAGAGTEVPVRAGT